MKLIAGLLGFGTFGYFYLRNRSPLPPGETPFYSKEFFSPAPWLWVLVLFLALAVRLYKLTSYLTFPIPDEVINAYNAIHILGRGNWQAFYYTSQMPPFYIWLLACVFKLWGVSDLSLWLLPALLSFLSVVFFLMAFREMFSKSVSLICLLLLAFGFWPVFLGRFSHNAVLMVFWEALALWLLAKLSKADTSLARAWLAAALGLCLGLGFYTYFGWPLIVLWFVPAVWFIRGPSPKVKNLFIPGLSAFLLAVLPLGVAGYKEGFGSYLKDLFLSSNIASNIVNWSINQWDFRQNLYYLTNFLWTGLTGQFAYNPQWGGFLNPVSGSLFLLGASEMFRLRKFPLVKWMAAGFLVLLFPCLLTNSANWYHVASLMPLFTVVSAWGFVLLWSRIPKKSARVFLFLAVILFSFLLDGANLEKTMAAADRQYSNPTVWTCENLRKLSKTHGPGCVYSDFCLSFNNPDFTHTYDGSNRMTATFFTSHWFPCFLNLGAYSFNALVNPALSPDQASWASIITDDWAKTLLTQSFPGAAFYTLDDHAASDNNLLAVIPLTPDTRKILDGWREADRTLRESDYLQFNHPYSQPYDGIIQYLRNRESLFRGNAFLRFYYWGKLADLYCFNNQFDLALPAFEKALQNGANGFLYYDLAHALGIAGLYAKAKEASLNAAKWESRFQPAPETLQKLDALIGAKKE